MHENIKCSSVPPSMPAAPPIKAMSRVEALHHALLRLRDIESEIDLLATKIGMNDGNQPIDNRPEVKPRNLVQVLDSVEEIHMFVEAVVSKIHSISSEL